MSLEGEDLKFIVVYLGVGVWGFFWGFKRLRRKRRIENIPTSTVRSLAMGLVELVGKAKIDKPLISPLTKTDCAYYRYEVERLEKSGKNSKWVTIAEGDSSSVPFWLDDGTGKVPILSKGAEFIMPEDYRYSNQSGGTVPENLLAFAGSHNVKLKSIFFGSTLRFREWYIKPEQEVYVLGTAKKVNNFLDDHKATLSKRLEELKTSPEKMKELDENKDGAVDQAEWDKAVSKVESDLLEKQLKSNEFGDIIDVAVTMGELDTLFIISDKSQKDILKDLSKQVLLGIYGGAALAIAMVIILILYIKNKGF